ncbi:MAG: radical SAM protein [Anaerolineae bacterium]|nr:radical SAM protein [Anaerolineae bacterium]
MLQKLVLNVSNDCNMRCRYCYAGGGSYGGNRALMTPQIACQAVERVFEHYKNVHTVMFFGGEPILNPDAIEVCCKRVLELYHQRAVLQMPRLGMVTNGLVLSRRMLDIIRRYELLVTVSLDGPAEINDLLRVSCDEKGSFRRIARNIRRTQEATGGREPSRIEATYTSAHHAAGFSVMDLADYFDREFGIRDCHVAPVAVEPGHRLGCRNQLENADVFREAAVQLVESWSTESPRQVFSMLGT